VLQKGEDVPSSQLIDQDNQLMLSLGIEQTAEVKHRAKKSWCCCRQKKGKFEDN